MPLRQTITKTLSLKLEFDTEDPSLVTRGSLGDMDSRTWLLERVWKVIMIRKLGTLDIIRSLGNRDTWARVTGE